MATRPLLLGHRGARGEKSIPENSVASFDRALSDGCDGFEFDVRLSADGQPVICHDSSVHGLEVAQRSAKELALPMLRDVLTRYQNRAFLDIELKIPGLESSTLNLLRAHPPARGYVISSFLPDVLQIVHGMDATVALGLICETQAQFNLWPSLPIEYVIPHKKLVAQSVVTEIRSEGRKVLVWTVNSIQEMKRFAGWGVDGIISDDPGSLVRTLRPNAQPSLRK
jgi:glycerophosphoryl diester phosphodiesterase